MRSWWQAYINFCERITAALLLSLAFPTMIVIYLLLLCVAGDPVVITDSFPGSDGALAKSFRFRTTGSGTSGFHTIGRFLRRYGIDEFPGLCSVIQGTVRLRDVLFK
jgi:lipopolysaccharide/colanic/teichoic acid biosynthesis glycosyltransferase